MANGENGTPLYVVTSQQETVDRTTAGDYVNGIRVTYRTRSGANGSVFVPFSEYTAQRARQLLDERAAEAEAIHNLGQES